MKRGETQPFLKNKKKKRQKGKKKKKKLLAWLI